MTADPRDAASRIVGSSAYTRDLLDKAAFCARVMLPVVVCGETGTAKDLFLDEVQRLSPGLPFLKVALGNVPPEIAASILYGHERGAFTSAHQSKVGLVTQACGGSLTFNDGGDLSMAVQELLLPVADGRAYRPLDATYELIANVRMIFVTHEPLRILMQHGRIRADLGYRLLRGIKILTIPLRDHMEDLPDIARATLANYMASFGGPVTGISDAALRRLARYNYPGNVRELEEIISEAASTMWFAGDAGVIGSKHIETAFKAVMVTATAQPKPRHLKRRELTEEVIATTIAREGSVAAAARAFPIGERSLWLRIGELGMKFERTD